MTTTTKSKLKPAQKSKPKKKVYSAAVRAASDAFVAAVEASPNGKIAVGDEGAVTPGGELPSVGA